MSTRRARIKAVASLPPRRKNAEVSDAVKNKQAESVEMVLKSPRTPRTPGSKVVKERTKPSSVSISPLPAVQTQETPSDQVEITECLGTLSEPSSLVKASTSTALSEKVSVIHASVISSRPLSSPIRASPLIHKPSPLARKLSPVTKSPHHKRDVPDLRFIGSPLLNHKQPLILSKVDNTQKTVDMTGQSNKNNIVNTGRNIDVPDDYSIPSVPESVTDEAGMDGIIPLQSVCSAPKPIDLLKNEIISDNAEVLFDPIVPLPSPSKVRPKLRPIPRLAPIRRNSVQGSASESEDESKRVLLANTPVPQRQRHDSHTSVSTLVLQPNREVTRIRNDSVSSNVSQAVYVSQTQVGSPIKEKHSKRRQEATGGHVAAMRKRRGAVAREAMTMYDLIFYNPTENPIVPDEDELKAKEENRKEAERNASKESEEEVDDPPEASAPVPQIKLGPNGEIILDESSLVIKQTANRKVSSVVREGAWGGGGGKYSRGPRTAEWSEAETVRFYRALAAIGTDFTLIAPLFPDRTRRDLKLKFKKEERTNCPQIDKALRSATIWDIARLDQEFREEREKAKRDIEEAKLKLLRDKQAEKDRKLIAKEFRVRPSRSFKAMELTVMPSVAYHEDDKITTANDFLERALNKKANNKRKPRRKTETPLKSHTPKTTPIPQNNSIQNLLDKTSMPTLPSDIENGSLVVLSVNDPKAPSKKMLQTYVSDGNGKLTPVAIPPTFLNSVVSYMKKGTPNSTASSSPLISPNNMPLERTPIQEKPQDLSTPKRVEKTRVVKVNPSPAKKARPSPYSLVQL